MSSKRVLRWVAGACLLGLLALPTRQLLAEPKDHVVWRETSGFWSDPANWWDLTTNGYPTIWPGSYLIAVYNGGDVTLEDTAGVNNVCEDLTIGTKSQAILVDTQVFPRGSGCLNVQVYPGTPPKTSLTVTGTTGSAYVGAIGTGTLKLDANAALQVDLDLQVGCLTGHGFLNAESPNSSATASDIHVGPNGTGILRQANGTITASQWLWIGCAGYGWGWYQLKGGDLRVTSEINISHGDLTQTGGHIYDFGFNAGTYVGLGVGTDSHGSYMQSGGTCTVSRFGLVVGLAIGESYKELYSASRPGARGPRGYYVIGGTGSLDCESTDASRPALCVGGIANAGYPQGSTGFLFLGRPDGWREGLGEPEEPWITSSSGGFVVRQSVGTAGIVRGWCETQPGGYTELPPLGINHMLMEGVLTNNGRIIADSYGYESRLLDLSNFSSVANTIDNVPDSNPLLPYNPAVDNGWFAQNHGLLYLQKPLVVTDANNPISPIDPAPPLPPVPYYWGDGASGGTEGRIDLINSLYMELTDPPETPRETVPEALPLVANVHVALLASDRDELEGDFSPLAAAWIPVGIWNLKAERTSNPPPEPAPSTVTLRLKSLKARYDNTQLSAAAEDHLQMVYRERSAPDWTIAPGAVSNSSDHTITTAAGALPILFTDALVGVAIPGVGLERRQRRNLGG